MEIQRIGENKIRCALTEEEIRQLGFDIEDIIGNSETTQQFMHVVLGLVEEHEDINMEHISPMVKAELLQNHSMAITFGEEREISFKELMDTVSQIMSQLEPEKLEQLRRGSGQAAPQLEPMVCALRFSTLDRLIRMSHACFAAKLPDSVLYKYAGDYYLIVDFSGFSQEEMSPFAFGMTEFDEGHFSASSQIAHIIEQGTCILKSEALETLMQL